MDINASAKQRMDSQMTGLSEFTLVGHFNRLGTNCDAFVKGDSKNVFGQKEVAEISKSDPDNTGNTMLVYNNGLAVDFGSYGLWYYDGTGWSRISTNNPEWLAAYNGSLVADGGSE